GRGRNRRAAGRRHLGARGPGTRSSGARPSRAVPRLRVRSSPGGTMFDLTGKVAIVTGGNGGIGLGMARGLASAGARVVVAARNQAKSHAAVRELEKPGGQPLAIAVDVADEASVDALIRSTQDRCGRLDILVNNAGTNVRKQPQDYTLADWHHVLDTNLTSAFLCSRAAYAPMKAVGGGQIITIGAMMSILGVSFPPASGPGRGGLVQLPKSLATAWARTTSRSTRCSPAGSTRT